MADKKIQFKIATPEKVVYENPVDSVTCMTKMGEVTILPGHIPLVATLVPGELKFVADGKPEFIAVTGGFLEVRKNHEVVILADAAEHAEEINVSRAEEARERARKLMSEKIKDVETYAEVQAQLERSLARLKVARRKKYRDVGKTI
jgi:F-type H+-transporting ATPase subunit epsilon